MLKNYLRTKTPLLVFLALTGLYASNSFANHNDSCKQLTGSWEGTWFGLDCGTLDVKTTVELNNENVRFDMRVLRESSTCKPPFDRSIMEGVCVNGKLSLNLPTSIIKGFYPLMGIIDDNGLTIKVYGLGLNAIFYKKG